MVMLLMPFPSRYGPVMNVVPWLIESDDEFPSASIKSGREEEKWENGKTSVREEISMAVSLMKTSTSNSTAAFKFLNTE